MKFKDVFIFHVHAIKSGVSPTIFASNQLIHLYSKHGLIRESQNLFNEMPQRNVFTWNAIINACLKSRKFDEAQALFEAAPEKDSVTYNSMICGYLNSDVIGYENRAIKLFTEMQHVNEIARIDEFTLTMMLNLAAKLSLLLCGRQLHSFMVKTCNALSRFALSSLIDMYSKCGCFLDALRVFNGCENGESMIDLVTKNAMVAACCREGKMEMARDIFLNKPELNDNVSWNTLTAGFAQNGCEKEAINLFKRMLEEGFRWNEHTLASVLGACSGLKSVKLGMEVHARILKEGMDLNPFISSGIIDVYSKCGNMKYANSVYADIGMENSYAITSMIVGYSTKGDMVAARKLFDSLGEKNSVVWTALLSGYVKSQQGKVVFELFRDLEERNASTTEALILLSLLGACAIEAVLDPGKQIHGYILRTGTEMDVKMVSALVDMYAKCGNLQYAVQIFRNAPDRDSVLYNVMIAGYAHHGHEYEAIQLFQEMIGKGFQPDAVTFLAILSACRHCGLVEAGEKYFSSMTKDFAVSAESEHYACMVDLYGRANQLDKAISLFEKIPMQPDSVILGTLLNACKLNRNLELAKVIEDKLLKIEGNNSARYMQLAGAYAFEGKWDEMERIMKKMRGKDLKKLAGYSWVHVGGKVHCFVSGDKSHSDTENIYSILECLIQELRARNQYKTRSIC